MYYILPKVKSAMLGRNPQPTIQLPSPLEPCIFSGPPALESSGPLLFLPGQLAHWSTGQLSLSLSGPRVLVS